MTARIDLAAHSSFLSSLLCAARCCSENQQMTTICNLELTAADAVKFTHAVQNHYWYVAHTNIPGRLAELSSALLPRTWARLFAMNTADYVALCVRARVCVRSCVARDCRKVSNVY